MKTFSKTDARYWLTPGKLKMYAGGTNFSAYIQYRGKRHSFSLDTANKAKAAKKAADLFKEISEKGLDAAIESRRPKKPKIGSDPDSVATVGEWIEEARKFSEVKATTFTGYERALRQIASEIEGLEKNESRFGPKKGGSTIFREKANAISLEVLTPEAIQTWKLEYVSRAKDPAKKKAAMTSCNSLIRQASSLFAPKVLEFVKLKRPTLTPFEKVKLFKGQSAKYVSKIDPKLLVATAKTNLAPKSTPAYLVFLLAIGAGLRRSEIDSLKWDQVDSKKGVIRVEVTEVADLKTKDSLGEVEIDSDLAAELLDYKTLAKGKGFVVKGSGKVGKKTWGQHYRADDAMNLLISWLRSYEQDGKKPLAKVRKPLHELRKELGALITQEHGIYAASRALRHSTVATTAAHYADKKARTTVGIGGWLNPDNSVATPSQSDTPSANKSQSTNGNEADQE
jgi:integrase